MLRAGINSAILALFFAMLASRWSSYWLQSRRVWAVRLTSVSFTGPRAFCRRFFVSASSFFFLSAVAVAMALAFVFSRAFFAAAAASAVSLAALISAATSVRSRRSARVGRMSTSVNTKVRVLNKTRRRLCLIARTEIKRNVPRRNSSTDASAFVDSSMRSSGISSIPPDARSMTSWASRCFIGSRLPRMPTMATTSCFVNAGLIISST